MAELAHTIARTVLKGAGISIAGSMGPVCAAIVGAHPDALLIALGNRYEAAFAYWRSNYADWVSAEEAFKSVTPYSIKQVDEYFADWKACGGDAVCKVSEDAWDTLQWLQHEVLSNPARTVTGLAVKARVIRGTYEADDIAGGGDCPEVAEYHASLMRDYAVEAKALGYGSELFQ